MLNDGHLRALWGWFGSKHATPVPWHRRLERRSRRAYDKAAHVSMSMAMKLPRMESNTSATDGRRSRWRRSSNASERPRTFGGQLAGAQTSQAKRSTPQQVQALANAKPGLRPHRVLRSRRPLAVAGEAVARTARAAGSVDAAEGQGAFSKPMAKTLEPKRRAHPRRRQCLEARKLAPCRSTQGRGQRQGDFQR